MTIEEAIEWCAIHHATIEFATSYSAREGDQEIVLLTPAHRAGLSYIGAQNTDGLISCVQRAQKAIWADWKYRHDFTRKPLPEMTSESVS